LPLNILEDPLVLVAPVPWAPPLVERKKTGIKIISFSPSLTNRNEADILLSIEGAEGKGDREVSLISPVDSLAKNLAILMDGKLMDIVPVGRKDG
jgi:hypothetical protein